MLKDVKKFIQKIESMVKNINLSLFEDFFESSSPDNYVKKLMNVKDPNENKEIVAKIKDRILDLKDRIREISEKEKRNKSADETLKIIEETLDYNKGAQKTFSIALKVDKGKSEPKHEKIIAKRVRLRRKKITKIKEEEKNINNELFKEYFTSYQSPSDTYKKVHETEGERNEDQVYSIKLVLDKIKKNH